jgi:hypothetical protein
MPQPAETTNYLILGLAFVFIPMALHLYSLYARFQNLKRDQALLEDLEQ